MKKIGLSILAFVLAMSVNAQINTPRELNCTEEAVTFKTSFSSGWHFSKPVFNQQRISTVVPDFMMSGLLPLKAVTPKIPEQQTFERPFSRFSQPIYSILPNKPLFTGHFDFKTKNLPDYLFPDSLYFRSAVSPLFR
jgi:hypothetical protein